MNMADRIQYLRKSKGISQEELADKVGVSRQHPPKFFLLLILCYFNSYKINLTLLPLQSIPSIFAVTVSYQANTIYTLMHKY